MFLGFIIFIAGYGIFYWGAHHFPGVDCPGPDPNACRQSLGTVFGIPASWQLSQGTPIQLKGIGGAGGSGSTSGSGAGSGSTNQPTAPAKPNPVKTVYCTICCSTSPLRLFGVPCPGCNC
jgi:hypothetical protein